MSIKLIDLKGQTFNLTFDGDITVQAIRQKLLKEYNYDTNRCYFCRYGKILQNEKISKEKSSQETSDSPIIIFNSQVYPDKSYPKVDDAFELNFSRYEDSFYNHKSKKALGIEMTDEDLYQLMTSPFHLENLINQGIIPPNRLFSRILNIARFRNNNQQDIEIHSESDDEEVEPISELPSNQQINIDAYDNDGFPPDVMLEDTFNIDDDLIMHDDNNFQTFFTLPQNEPDFILGEHQPEDFLYVPDISNHVMPIGIDVEQPQEEEQHPEQQGHNIQPQNENGNDLHNEQQRQQLLDEQQQVDRQMQLDQQLRNNPPPDDAPIMRNRMPFPFDFERRQDDIDQQIIESLNLNITLSEADHRAISRLARAGYDRATVIQVYETCDRNEEAAMNLLVAMG